MGDIQILLPCSHGNHFYGRCLYSFPRSLHRHKISSITSSVLRLVAVSISSLGICCMDTCPEGCQDRRSYFFILGLIKVIIRYCPTLQLVWGNYCKCLSKYLTIQFICYIQIAELGTASSCLVGGYLLGYKINRTGRSGVKHDLQRRFSYSLKLNSRLNEYHLSSRNVYLKIFQIVQYETMLRFASMQEFPVIKSS